MSEQEQMLEVVDENDNVIGLETRAKVHQEGLLHREIHVWFMTPNREIIFQHRAKDKDTYPDLLDATIGGHVEPGMTYEETAFKEGEEETGITLDSNKLKLIRKIHKKTFDEVTGRTNNTIRSQYAYLFDAKVEDLKVESGKSIGFEAWPINSLSNLTLEDKRKFIPAILSQEFLDIFEEGQKILGLR